MSYIRSSSNPEGLYVFGTYGGIEIYCNQIVEDNGCSKCICTNSKDWNAMCKSLSSDEYLWDLLEFNGEECLRFGDISLREVWYNEDENKVITSNELQIIQKNWLTGGPEVNYHNAIELGIGNDKIYLWRTTWFYLVDSIKAHYQLDRPIVRLKHWIYWNIFYWLNPRNIIKYCKTKDEE